MTDSPQVDGPLRLLLVGEPPARPAGLEVTLAREGFRVAETRDLRDVTEAPDVVLATLRDPAAVSPIAETLGYAFGPAVPLVVALDSTERGAAARALAAGATDAMQTPVDLAELSARLKLRRRSRSHARQAAPRLDDALAFASDLVSAWGPEEVLHHLCERVARTLELERCSFVLTTNGHGRVLADDVHAGVLDLDLDLAQYPEIEAARRSGEPVVVGDTASDPIFEPVRRRLAPEQLPRSVIAVPVRAAGCVAGVFMLRPRTARTGLARENITFVAGLARAGASALRGLLPTEHASLAALDDPAGLEARLREEVERARRYALGFSLVLLEVDDFAAFAATRGSSAGERLLAQVAALLRESFRAPDLVARQGTARFAVVLPETVAARAVGAVQRLRSRITDSAWDGLDEGVGPFLTAGLVGYPHPSAETADDVLSLAEAALLRARAQSGDRIGVAEVGAR